MGGLEEETSAHLPSKSSEMLEDASRETLAVCIAARAYEAQRWCVIVRGQGMGETCAKGRLAEAYHWPRWWARARGSTGSFDGWWRALRLQLDQLTFDLPLLLRVRLSG